MDRVKNLFTDAGLRCTKQREVIYRALESTTAHPTAEELFAIVKKKNEAHGREVSLSLATVYNTLDAFVRRGLCRKFVQSAASGGSVARYDADVSEHCHLITDHGRVRDVPGDLSRRLVDHLPADVLEELEQRMGVSVEKIRIEITARETGGRSC